MNNISGRYFILIFLHIEKVLKKGLPIRNSHNFFNSLSGQPDIWQMKPDILPDTRYKKAGYPVQYEWSAP